MKNVTADVVMKYIPKKSQIKMAELILEDLGNRKTRYIVKLNENYWFEGNREFQIENFKELLVTLKDKVVYDETPEPWNERTAEEIINTVEEREANENWISKTKYEKQCREYCRTEVELPEGQTFKGWFKEHLEALETMGRIKKEIGKNGQMLTYVLPE